MRILRVILVLGAAIHLTGSHYGVLQCIAWVNMLVEYSADDGLIEGTKKTFDGEHPCELCMAISDAREDESNGDDETPLPTIEKLSLKDLKCPEMVTLEPPGQIDYFLAAYMQPYPAVSPEEDSPPIPPPRGV